MKKNIAYYIIIREKLLEIKSYIIRGRGKRFGYVSALLRLKMSSELAHKKNNVQTFLSYGILFLILYFIFSVSKLSSGDDLLFVDWTKGHSLLSWLDYRYATWSSRIFSEAAVYLIFGKTHVLWYIINPIAMIGLAWSIIRVLKEAPKFYEVVLATLLLLMMPGNVFTSSILWMTGAIFYLWPTAIGVFALIPYADAVFRGKTDLCARKAILSAVLLFLASLGTEQITACLFGFVVCSHLYFLIKKKKISLWFYIIPAAMVAALVLITRCPGNAVRILQEEGNWYPGFFEMSTTLKIGKGFIWVFEKIFNVARSFIFILSALIVYGAVIGNAKERKHKAVPTIFISMFLFAIGVQLASMAGMDTQTQPFLFHFSALGDFLEGNPIWALFAQEAGTLFMMLFPYIFWTVYTIFMVWTLLDNTKHKGFIALALLASLLSLVMMFVSPTIYASANRVLFVLAVLFVMVILFLIKEYKLWGNKYILWAALLFAAANMVYVMSFFKNGYAVIY